MSGTDPKIVVEGLSELRRALRYAEPEMKKALVAALRKSASAVLPKARAKAPSRTGRLKRSIRIYARQSGAAIGSPRAYAPVLEFAYRNPGGKRKRDYSGLSETWGKPPRFLIPAVEESVDEVRAAVERDLAGLLDRIIPRGPV